MQDAKFQQVIEDIATMKSEFHSLHTAFAEFKQDTKEFHKTQTEKFDELARTWQEFGGVIKMAADNAREIRELEKVHRNDMKEANEKIESLNSWRNKLLGAYAFLLLIVAYLK